MSRRNRRHRAQDKIGIAMASVPVFNNDNIRKLIESGNLTEAEALIPGNVIAAYSEIIAIWFHTCPADLELLKSAGRVPRNGRKAD